MSEYWVSNKKYYCSYCGIFVADNKISRTNHENGKKHKENVGGYLQDVYKRQGEKSVADADTAGMLAQIEQAANKQYALDTRTKREPGAWNPDPARTPVKYEPTAGDAEVANILEALDKRRAARLKKEQGEEETQLVAAKKEKDRESHPFGSWSAVEKPTKHAGSTALPGWADDGDEEEPEENLTGFKVLEKVASLDEDHSVGSGIGGDGIEPPTAGFKKRKLAGGKAARNVRKKD